MGSRRAPRHDHCDATAARRGFLCFIGGMIPDFDRQSIDLLQPRLRQKTLWLGTMAQNILSNLGGYLLAHREEVIGEWLRAVERNPDITSSDVLRYEELVDHLPKLFENLAGLLKSPHSNPQRHEVCRDARVHGKHRWRQGFRLEEVIREASIVRHILFDKWLDTFARDVPEFDGATRKVAESIIRQAVDDIFTESAEQFEKEQQKSRAVSHR